MRHCILALAAASVAVAAPSLNARQVPGLDLGGAVGGVGETVTDTVGDVADTTGETVGEVTDTVTDTVGGATDTVDNTLGGLEGTPIVGDVTDVADLDLGSLLEDLLAAGGGVSFRQDMTAEEVTAMREIESIFGDLRQKLEHMSEMQQQHGHIARRQLDILSSIPIVGPLLAGLLGGVTGGVGGGAGGDLLGGLLGGGGGGDLLGGLLGRVEEISDEEMELAREAEVLLEEALRSIAKENGQDVDQAVAVAARQLEVVGGLGSLLLNLPIVGPLLQGLLGLAGGVTGGTGGVGGAVGGLTGTAGGLLGGLTGGATGGATDTVGNLVGGATGTAGNLLGGLTGGGGGGAGNLLGGLTGSLNLGGLLGKEDLKVTKEQESMLREAEDVLMEMIDKMEARVM